MCCRRLSSSWRSSFFPFCAAAEKAVTEIKIPSRIVRTLPIGFEDEKRTKLFFCYLQEDERRIFLNHLFSLSFCKTSEFVNASGWAGLTLPRIPWQAHPSI